MKMPGTDTSATMSTFAMVYKPWALILSLQSPIDSPVKRSYSQGVDDMQIRAQLLDNYNLEIGAGLGDLAGKVWRTA